MSSPLFFIHATKTAGGTLKRAFKKLEDKKIHFVYGEQDRQNIDPSSQEIIYGHYAFGVHERHGIDNPKYAIFLRNPYNRVVSHYHHIVNVAKMPFADHIRAAGDINDYFARKNIRWEFSNLLVRMISGHSKFVTDWEETYAQAIKNLEHFEFIGIQEMFDLSMKSLEHYLGTDLTIDKNINIGKYEADTIKRETAERIIAENQYDAKLYAYCFERQFKRKFELDSNNS